MKRLLLCIFCISGFICNAQTSKELIGKWKLVKQTKDRVEKTPVETYQVFKDGGEFTGMSDGKSRNGKWKLSDDNKELKISISIISVKFSVDYFDEKKRVITSSQTGTLEYEKVEE